MKHITKKSYRTVILSLLLAVLTASFINKDLPIADFGKLNKKAYYTKLFSKKEIRKLNKARENIREAQTEIKEAERLFDKAEIFNKIKKDARYKRDRRRADRKERRYLRKAFRAGLGAYEDIFDDREYIYHTYDQRLRKFKNDSSNYHRFAEKYTQKSRELYAKQKARLSQAKNQDKAEQYKSYKETDSQGEQVLKYQQMALGLFMKDKKIDLKKLMPEKEDQKDDQSDKETPSSDDKEKDPETPSDTTKQDTSEAVVYRPQTDPNMYKPLTDSILTKLDIKKSDSSLLRKASAKENRAEELMAAVEIRYKRIDTLFIKIDNEKNKRKKELLKQDAAEIEKEIFKDLAAAAELYIEANDIKYQIYSKYFSEARPKDEAGKLSKGRSFEESAKELKLMSTSSIASANLQMYVSEKYLQLMNAVQLQLSALQEQENAYAVYYGWPVTPLKKTFKIKYYADTDEQKPPETGVGKDKDKTEDEQRKTTRKYSYNYAGSYYYTKENPKPRKLHAASGTVFKIQVGIFKRLLSTNTFGEFSPISYDEFTNNPYKRFMVGRYKSKEAAEYALGKIKEMGIDDAFIVAYKDGKRQAYRTAAKKIQKDDKYQKTAQKELEDLRKIDNDKSGTLSYPDFVSYGDGPDDFARGIDISNVKGLAYTVQIGFYKMPKTNNELKNISPLYREITDEGIKYLAGIFNSYQAAKNQAKAMKNKGFKQAFVSAYNNGNHISLQKAKNIKKSSQSSTDQENMQPNIYFSVQIGAYSSLLPAEKEQEFNNLSEHYTISAKNGKNGLIIYTIGQFLNYKDAKTFAQSLKPKHPDVFVVAFKNETRISVPKAIKLTEK